MSECLALEGIKRVQVQNPLAISAFNPISSFSVHAHTCIHVCVCVHVFVREKMELISNVTYFHI